MEVRDRGSHQLVWDNIEPSSRYLYGLTYGHGHPDPASTSQPEGVRGASEVVQALFFKAEVDAALHLTPGEVVLREKETKN
jgi:1,4-alpha-glucan branching enzyme